MSLFKKKKQPLPSEIQDNDEKTLTSATEQNKYAVDILLDSCPTKQIITSLNDVLEATYPSCKQKVYEIDQAVLALIKENVVECKHYAMDSANDKLIELHVNYRVATIKRLLEIRDKADMGEINADETDLYKDVLKEYELLDRDAKVLQEISKVFECTILRYPRDINRGLRVDLKEKIDRLLPSYKKEVLSIDMQILPLSKRLGNENYTKISDLLTERVIALKY